MEHGAVAVANHQGSVANHATPVATHAGSVASHTGLMAGHGGPHAAQAHPGTLGSHAGPDELEALLRTIGAEEAYAHAHQQLAPKPQLQQIAAPSANAEPLNIEKRHKCDYCPFACNNSGDYKRHMRTHTGEKPFECDKCGAKFARSGHLKVHMKYHSGDKPHQCTQCPTSFVQAGDLKKHMRYHTGEKPYQCNQCQAKFIQLAGLKAHVRTHTGEKPFKCETCDKCFKTKTDLLTHERGHTGEKPYDCILCPSKFLTSGHLRRHERSKHGENVNTPSEMLQCKQCHSKFNSKTRLTLHVERYHGGSENDNINPNPPLSVPQQHVPHMNMPVNSHLGMPVMMSPGFAMNHMPPGGPPHSAVSQSMMPGASSAPPMNSSDTTSMMSGAGGVVASANMTPYPIMSNHGRHFSYPSMASMMNPSLVSLQPSNLIPPTSSQMLGNYTNLNDPNVSQGYGYHTQTTAMTQPEPPVPPQELVPEAPTPPKPKYTRRFFCTTCNKGFINAGDLEKHNRTHTGEKPFKCDECESCFTQASHLKTHKKYHSGERNHVCSECEKAFVQSYELKQHMRTHTGEKPYGCTLCPKKFSQRNNLREHERLHTGEKPYKCDLCPAKFRASSGLWTHKLSHSTKEGIKNYKCMQCDGKYSTSSHLRRHERCHWSIPPKKHHCTECEHSYTRVDNLRLHMKKCHPTKAYHLNRRTINSDSEPKADESSSREDAEYPTASGAAEDDLHELGTDSGGTPNVSNTNKSVASGSIAMIYQPSAPGRQPSKPIDTSKRSFACGMCLKPFANAGDLEKHVRIHTGEKPFHCLQCKAKFAQAVHLKTHMRYHTGDRPFDCSDCSKSFFTSSELKRHSLTHSGEKPYKCTVCDARFARSITLAGHVRKHTGERPYRCGQCPKGFKTSEGLRIHKLTHTGEKRHECKQCSSKFATSSHLRRHERTHKKEEVKLKCPHCTCIYTKQWSLKRHIKEVHTGKTKRSDVLTSLADSLSVGAKKRDTRVGSKKRKPAVVKRRFLCDQCGSTFQTAPKFKQHLEKVHEIEVISFEDLTTKSTKKRRAPRRKSAKPARVPVNTQPDHPSNEDGESSHPIGEATKSTDNAADSAEADRAGETDPERPLTPSDDDLENSDPPVSPEHIERTSSFQHVEAVSPKHGVSATTNTEILQIMVKNTAGSSPTVMNLPFSSSTGNPAHLSSTDELSGAAETGLNKTIEDSVDTVQTERGSNEQPVGTLTTSQEQSYMEPVTYEQANVDQTERVVDPPASPDSVKQDHTIDESDQTDEDTDDCQTLESNDHMETNEYIYEQN